MGVEDPSRLLRPLLEAALDNALEFGDKAMTGPVVRGDVGTVQAHLAALADNPPDIEVAYRALATAGLQRAHDRRAVPAESVGPMLAALAQDEQQEEQE